MEFVRETRADFVKSVKLAKGFGADAERVRDDLLGFFPLLKPKLFGELDVKMLRQQDNGEVAYGDQLQTFEFFRAKPLVVVRAEEVFPPFIIMKLMGFHALPVVFVNRAPLKWVYSLYGPANRFVGMGARVGETFPNYYELRTDDESKWRADITRRRAG